MDNPENEYASAIEYPAGARFDLDFSEFSVQIETLSESGLRFLVPDGPFKRTEVVRTTVVNLRPGLFLVSWQESDGSTVVHAQDFLRRVVHSRLTFHDGRLFEMASEMKNFGHVPDLPNHRRGQLALRENPAEHHGESNANSATTAS